MYQKILIAMLIVLFSSAAIASAPMGVRNPPGAENGSPLSSGINNSRSYDLHPTHPAGKETYSIVKHFSVRHEPMIWIVCYDPEDYDPNDPAPHWEPRYVRTGCYFTVTKSFTFEWDGQLITVTWTEAIVFHDDGTYNVYEQYPDGSWNPSPIESGTYNPR